MRHPEQRSGKRKVAGFSLLEVVLVLIVLAILASSFAPTLSSQIEQQQRRETQKLLSNSRQALIGFAIINKHLPCPALDTQGLENPANCDQEGWLPWQTLALPRHDGWGNLLRYRVDTKFTSAPIEFLHASKAFSSKLEIRDKDGQKITLKGGSTGEHPVFIILSYGKNRLADMENDQASDQHIYQQDEPTQDFDDMLEWLGRPQLLSNLIYAELF